MIPLLAALIAAACVGASGCRLFFAMTSTRYALGLLVKALRGDVGATRVRRLLEAIRKSPVGIWERELLDALEVTEPRLRAAEVNEQLTELDFLVWRWSRVPRVCASVSSSSGFLLAALLMRRGLADPSSLGGDVAILVTSGLVGQALSVAGFGLAGALACATLHVHAQRVARERLAAADELVERLEVLIDRKGAERIVGLPGGS